MTAKVEEMKKKAERYAKLLAERIEKKASAEQIRLFRKKMKRWQRRARKATPPAKKVEEGAAAGEKKEEAKKA